MKISVIFPTLNEEKTVGACIEMAQKVLSRHQYQYEIIVCDYSTDRTADIAEKCGATIVFCKRRGYGNAYHEGVQTSQGDILVMADADGTYNLMELPAFLDVLVSGKADLVIGDRFAKMEKGAMPWHKKAGNLFLTAVLNMLFGTRITDAHCGMRAVTRKAYEKMDLNCEGMEYASEMLVKAQQCNLRMKEVPITYGKRRGSPSKLNAVKDGWRHFAFLVCCWIRTVKEVTFFNLRC